MAENNENVKAPYKVFFISDTHIGHKNILRFSPERIKAFNLRNDDDIQKHDDYIINMFNTMTKRGDHVYIIGDFIMTPQDQAIKILHRIKSNGVILHLIVGNHDKSTKNMNNMFESIDLIKNVTFKQSTFPFLGMDLQVVMCHYPFKSWSNKCRGSLNLYGHVHNNSPWLDDSDDLALNVGLDASFSNYELIPLEKVWKWYKNRIGDNNPKDYINKLSEFNKTFVR